MPRPTSLDNILTDKVTIQIPSAATEIMDQGDDKMDELGRTLLDLLLSFACTASMFTKIVLQVLRQAETRYGPHAETQLRTSIAGVLMTAFRQYFVGVCFLSIPHSLLCRRANFQLLGRLDYQ